MWWHASQGWLGVLIIIAGCGTSLDVRTTNATPTVVAYQPPTRTPTVPAPSYSPGPMPTPPRPFFAPRPTSDRTPVPTSTFVPHPPSLTEIARVELCRTPLPLSDTWTPFRSAIVPLSFEYPSTWSVAELPEIRGTHIRVANQPATCESVKLPPAIVLIQIDARPILPDDLPPGTPRPEDGQHNVEQRTFRIQGVPVTLRYSQTPDTALPWIFGGADIRGHWLTIRGAHLIPEFDPIFSRLIRSIRFD